MNYTIASYTDYNERRYGTPWAAICDSTGRPEFKGKVGHFTGGKGEGGDLFVVDPAEGSVWVYGQKDYRGTNTTKAYAQFRDGAFHPIAPACLAAALNAAPSRETVDEVQKIIKAMEDFLQTEEEDARLLFTKEEARLLLGRLK